MKNMTWNKTTRRLTGLLKLALGVVLLTLSVQTSVAYYDPGVQRWINRDPILEAGGVNQYAYVANRPQNRMDPVGLTAIATEGSCPGTPPNKHGENCYQYACDNYGRNSDVVGARGGKRCPAFNCEKLRESALADGLTDVPEGGECPEGTHKVAYASGSSGPGPDYHWLRRVSDGTWCHKFKTGKPSNRDGSGKPMTDPEKANLNWPASSAQGKSYKFCGYLCAPNTWQ